MGLSRIISQINSDFGQKSQKKFPPHVFNAPVTVPLEFRNVGIAQKVMLWKEFDNVLSFRYGMVWYGILEFNVPLDTV